MLKHPYNPKGAQTHLPRLSASVRGAQKHTFFISSKLRIRTRCLDIFRGMLLPCEHRAENGNLESGER